MATFSLSHVVTLYVFFNINLVFSEDYEALLVIDDLPSRPSARLPYKAAEENDEINYPETTEDGEKIEYSYLCPYHTPQVVQEVTRLSAQYPDFSYFLEKNTMIMPIEPSKCLREVKPLLIKDNSQDSKCSNLYNFAFNYIKLISNESSSTETSEIVTLRVYDLCFNTEKGIIWTRHHVLTGLMLYGNGLPTETIQPPFDYSTQPYYSFPQDLFVRVANGYNNQEQYAQHRMVPQMMVPHEDLALKLWKKTALHYVNTAPLWENLIPLMKAINDGIRKAGIMVSVETYDPRTQQSDNLDIYTTTISYLNHPRFRDLVKSYYIFQMEDFGLNIWCKFIHHESQGKGVLIFLHNLPNILMPRKMTPTPGSLESAISYENAECEYPVPCDIRRWSDEPELSADLLNYAYCCPVHNEKVNQLFGIELDTDLGLLNIDEFIDRPATLPLL